MILGLGMGERLVVPRDIKRLMQETGTSHLMAISGLHIALGAILGGLVVRGLQFFFPCRWIGWRMPLLIGLGCALFYAWLTGMQPPAVRTCVALSCVVGLRLSARRWSSWQIWLCCIGAILFADPLAVLSDSLWLSIFAVATLIFWYQLGAAAAAYVALAVARRACFRPSAAWADVSAIANSDSPFPRASA